ncbi:MAG: glycosyltransferase family 4 protein [Chloroflexi bacterium]|nr:MAG: glycosyltransferase family 4 protein [Chloroflexota bacterium]
MHEATAGVPRRAMNRRAGQLPRLCIVGPMVGRNPGYVTTQGELLTDYFRAAGYDVISVSSSPNRYMRLLDITATLVRCLRRVDIVLVEVYGGLSFLVEDVASALARVSGGHTIMHLHGGAMPEFMARFPRWTRRVLGRADAIVTPSGFLATAGGTYDHVLRIIPNVIDLAACPFRQRNRLRARLFWMRSFHRTYNPLMALRVLERVRSVYPDATLVMAGQDKGLEGMVHKEAARVGLDGAARFVGFLNPAAKVREGDAADIFINTSSVDNLPGAVIEACAMGLPVVSTAVGGVPYLLTDNETGLLVPDNDSNAMAQAVTRLLGDPALATRLSSNGRRVAERFCWEQVGRQWEELFAQLRAARSDLREESET